MGFRGDFFWWPNSWYENKYNAWANPYPADLIKINEIKFLETMTWYIDKWKDQDLCKESWSWQVEAMDTTSCENKGAIMLHSGNGTKKHPEQSNKNSEVFISENWVSPCRKWQENGTLLSIIEWWIVKMVMGGVGKWFYPYLRSRSLMSYWWYIF